MICKRKLGITQQQRCVEVAHPTRTLENKTVETMWANPCDKPLSLGFSAGNVMNPPEILLITVCVLPQAAKNPPVIRTD